MTTYAAQLIGSRDSQQDRYLTRDGKGLAIVAVADGMGGYAGGAEAAACALGVLESALGRGDSRMNLSTIPQVANTKIKHLHYGSGTTYSMLAVTLCSSCADDKVMVVHVGDTRVYSLHAGKLRQWTRDDTAYQEHIEVRAADGKPPVPRMKAAANHILTQALGKGAVKTQVVRGAHRRGTVYLLTSDGVHDVLSDVEIREVLEAVPHSEACRALVQKAIAAGGTDNATAVLLDVEHG